MFAPGMFPVGMFPVGVPEPQEPLDVPFWAMAAYLIQNIADSGGVIVYHVPVGARKAGDYDILAAGDTSGDYVYQLLNDFNQPVPVSVNSAVVFKMWLIGADELAIEEDAVVDYGPLGILKFSFSEDTPVPDAGTYHAVFVVDGKTLPLNGPILLKVEGIPASP